MFDDVNGQIIGGDYGRAWVTYKGRKQGQTCYPANEIEAVAQCEAIVEDIKTRMGTAFRDIFSDSDGWKFHLDGI